jgi:oligosaccharide repeat unit polymerase
MIYLFSVSYILCLVLIYLSVKHTLPFFYMIFFGVMYFGTVLNLEINLDSDLFYFLLILCFLFSYTITTIFFNIKYSISKNLKVFKLQPIIYDSNKTINIFWFLTIISSVLTLVYFYLLGYNIFFLVFNDFSAADITTARVNAYSGESYFAPGYFNQFKNVILPVTITALIFNKIKSKKILYYFFIPIAFFGLVGTGQRAFLIYTFLSILLTTFFLGKFKIKSIIIPSVIIIIIFGAGSFFLGRTDEFTIATTLENLLTRVFYNEQYEALITFRYLYEIPITYGYDWFRGIIGIFPGIKGSEIQHIVFGLIHGNPRGTAALSFIGSIYHNFGFIGVIFVSSLLAFLVNYITFNFLKNKKNVGNIVFFSFITFYISIYSSGDIVFLFNKGVVLLMLLSYIIYKVRLIWKI